METLSESYRPFIDFIDQYLPDEFQHIDPDSPLMLDLERMMEANNQFFFIGNLLQMKIFFTSKKSIDLIGMEPREVDPASFLRAVHPDDLARLINARTRLFRLAGEVFLAKKGIAVISTTLRFLSLSGRFVNQLIQCYLFYESIRQPAVYILQVNTDISWFNKIKYGYHYYIGDDMAFFRYPDEKLLLTGNIFSAREFEIITLASEGLNSEQISKKLFLSVHTIETHRRNVLKKSGKSSIIEVILDLKNRGLL